MLFSEPELIRDYPPVRILTFTTVQDARHRVKKNFDPFLLSLSETPGKLPRLLDFRSGGHKPCPFVSR